MNLSDLRISANVDIVDLSVSAKVVQLLFLKPIVLFFSLRRLSLSQSLTVNQDRVIVVIL